MNDHCFNFLTNLINPYLNNRFIFYENGNEDLSKQKNELFFCSKPLNKTNSWIVLSEPKSSEVDRCANTKTKLVKYKKYTLGLCRKFTNSILGAFCACVLCEIF